MPLGLCISQRYMHDDRLETVETRVSMSQVNNKETSSGC